MEQIRALNALEPFIALSKSANSPRAAADLVTQATSAPNTYVFAELLQTPNIQALRSSPDYSSYLTLLGIFAWGTWADYSSTTNLPPLSPAQHQKLLLLSLLPLASNPRNLTYAALQSALGLPTPTALESLLTAAIYANLLAATLDPARGVVAITAVAPLRDLAPGSVPGMQAALAAWAGRCAGAEREVEAMVEDARRKAGERERRAVERAVDAAVGAAEEGAAGGKGGKRGGVAVGGGGMVENGAGGGDGDVMDVDREEEVLGRGGAGGGRRRRGDLRVR